MGVLPRAKPGFPLLEIGPKNQNFLENLKSAAQFQLINLILAMTVYLQERGRYVIESLKWLLNSKLLQISISGMPVVKASLTLSFLWQYLCSGRKSNTIVQRFVCHSSRPVTSLGRQGAKIFLRGSQIFEPCPIVLNYVQHIFQGEANIFFKGVFARPCAPPSYGPAFNFYFYCRLDLLQHRKCTWYHTCAVCDSKRPAHI